MADVVRAAPFWLRQTGADRACDVSHAHVVVPDRMEPHRRRRKDLLLAILGPPRSHFCYLFYCTDRSVPSQYALRSSRLRILPAPDIGSASANSTLNCGTFLAAAR